MSINLLSNLINNYFEIIQTGNIIWSDSTTIELKFINSGVPNAAYYDTKLKGVVKFRKHDKDKQSNLIDKIQSKDDIEKNKEEYDNIMNNIAHSPLIEYLKDYKDFYGFKKDEDEIKDNALSSFLEVVKDFNTFNTEFMFTHGDLQNNCRNIMYNKITNKFKVIDIVSPKLIIPSRPEQLNNLISEIIFDIKSLINCYKNTWKLEIDIDNLIDINKLKKELTSDKNNLFCVKDIPNTLLLNYNPYIDDCELKDIYVDTSKEVVKQIILKFINECYTKFIGIIEEDIQIIPMNISFVTKLNTHDL